MRLKLSFKFHHNHPLKVSICTPRFFLREHFSSTGDDNMSIHSKRNFKKTQGSALSVACNVPGLPREPSVHTFITMKLPKPRHLGMEKLMHSDSTREI